MTGSDATSGRVPPDPAVLARRVFRAISTEDAGALAELIHPNARLEMVMAQGRVVRSREKVLDVLREAWSRTHSLQITRVHRLSDQAVALEGRSRHRIGDSGFLADSKVVWLHEYRSGMLYRQRLFRTVEEARAAWDQDVRRRARRRAARGT